MTPEEYKSQHATLCANVATKGAEIERLRAALKPFAGLCIHEDTPGDGMVIVTDLAGGIVDTGSNRVKVSDIRNARHAYQQQPDASK